MDGITGMSIYPYVIHTFALLFILSAKIGGRMVGCNIRIAQC
jgi:hypothetical protein